MASPRLDRSSMIRLAAVLFAVTTVSCPAALAQERALIDTHIHYSHDAWEMLPPAQALEVLRAAGLSRAFVSSSSDEGTQKLYALAPDFIVPVLRPYRRRGELSTWMHDETVIDMLESRLAASPYAGIGEFHVFGADADLPVVRRVVELAGQYGIFLHAHADAEAVERLFAQDPDIRILWAHSGFTGPNRIRQMLAVHDNLQADLAFRGEFAQGGKLNPSWRQLFLDFPERFMTGTDTYTPERWYAVADTATFSRGWLADLPEKVATLIGHDNGSALADRALANWSAAQASQSGTSCVADAQQRAIRLQGADNIAVIILDPSAVAVGEVFGADIVACRADGSTFEGDLLLDATMPAHGHGMNNAVAVSRTGSGRFRADGLMFHMPGVWRIHIELSGSSPDELNADLTVR